MNDLKFFSTKEVAALLASEFIPKTLDNKTEDFSTKWIHSNGMYSANVSMDEILRYIKYQDIIDRIENELQLEFDFVWCELFKPEDE